MKYFDTKVLSVETVGSNLTALIIKEGLDGWTPIRFGQEYERDGKSMPASDEHWMVDIIFQKEAETEQKKRDETVEEAVEKIFKIVFVNFKDWNEASLFEDGQRFETEIIQAIFPLIKREKDRLLAKTLYPTFISLKCFHDIYYRFNDTINKYKGAIIEFISILNE